MASDCGHDDAKGFARLPKDWVGVLYFAEELSGDVTDNGTSADCPPVIDRVSHSLIIDITAITTTTTTTTTTMTTTATTTSNTNTAITPYSATAIIITATTTTFYYYYIYLLLLLIILLLMLLLFYFSQTKQYIPQPLLH